MEHFITRNRNLILLKQSLPFLFLFITWYPQICFLLRWTYLLHISCKLRFACIVLNFASSFWLWYSQGSFIWQYVSRLPSFMCVNNIPISLKKKRSHFSSIHQLTFVFLHFLTVGKSVIRSNHEPVFLGAYFQFFEVIHVKVEWLGCVLFLCLTFWGMTRLVSVAREPF